VSDGVHILFHFIMIHILLESQVASKIALIIIIILSQKFRGFKARALSRHIRYNKCALLLTLQPLLYSADNGLEQQDSATFSS